MTAKTRRAALFAEMLATQIGGTRQLLQRGFYRSIFGRHLWRGQNIRVVFDYPAHLKPGSPERGELWLAGDYTLDGGFMRQTMHQPEKSPFDLSPVSPIWLESLHSFDWLRHVLAAYHETELEAAKNHAAHMVLQWCLHADQQPRQAMKPQLVARRLMAWSAALPILRKQLGSGDLSLVAHHNAYAGALVTPCCQPDTKRPSALNQCRWIGFERADARRWRGAVAPRHGHVEPRIAPPNFGRWRPY